MTDHDLIHAYSRAEAIADGVLIDVSRQASPAEMRGGFNVPVAVTAALWSAISESIPDRLVGVADVRGRLHDVLWMAAAAARGSRQLFAHVQVVMPRRGASRSLLHLAVAIGPGDDGEPVVTIGFPEDFDVSPGTVFASNLSARQGSLTRLLFFRPWCTPTPPLLLLLAEGWQNMHPD